jgi:hypothetical protein
LFFRAIASTWPTSRSSSAPLLEERLCDVIPIAGWRWTNMTSDDFRRLALSFPETSEQAHMEHPDFRVRGKIFATLGYPDEHHGMVKLFPDQREEFVRAAPDIFAPAKGAWGRQGATTVLLHASKKAIVKDAMNAAWHNPAPKTLAESFDKQGSQTLNLQGATPVRGRAKSSRPAPRRRADPR